MRLQAVCLGRPCASRKAGGSGIGFGLARAAIARHGGMVRIESSGPAGTAIAILLAERADGRCSQPERNEVVCDGSHIAFQCREDA